MGFLTEWLTNIILLILLATILELMLPNSNMQRYVKMVVGLLLLVVMLQPLLTIFKEDVDEWLFSLSRETEQTEQSINNQINLQKREIELGQRAYHLEQVAVQLKRQVTEALEKDHKVQITDVSVDIVEEKLERFEQLSEEQIIDAVHAIHVQVQNAPEVTEEVEGSREVSPIQTVNIDTTLPVMNEKLDETNKDLEPVQQFLSENWYIPKEKILLVWEGGERAE
ncbi:stage III sporulation protein AF [Halalkalibacter krulwichiae]|uniref:Stage III sporulation protein AF (Spore_III_AF) n=1 Tax=Halalkalibacter krulwichiae TaxID=199441 RepID=A0A1X9ML01_9BACI|nr:stage III sporulation protein AF [Halalkalibacter krulwichiae]ARK31402.1 Stage III sporulation protein AF (Spore_III_AF) [Halalkalibacter krulwichiae]